MRMTGCKSDRGALDDNMFEYFDPVDFEIRDDRVGAEDV